MKRTILLLLLIMSSMWLVAQTLDECRQLTLEHYPEIRQYDLISQTEHYNVSNAARAWIPQVSLSAQFTWQTDIMQFPDNFAAIFPGGTVPSMKKDQYKIQLDVQQNIWDGGQSKANSDIAKADAAEQRSRVDVDIYNLMLRVDNLYFGILLLDERKELTETMISMLDNNLQRMRVYRKNDVVIQADVDAIEAELLTARQTLRQVCSSRDSYRRMLEIFIGQPLEDSILVRPTMFEIVNQTSARPELALFAAQSGKLQAQRKAINSSLTPRFVAFAQGFYGYPGLNMFESMMGNDWKFGAILGVRMVWNIGGFYTMQNNVDKLKTAQLQVDMQRDIFEFNTSMQSTQDNGEIARLRKAVEDDDRIVELRRSVRMAAESKLENGTIDATDLLLKISDETTAALNRSSHEIELLQAVYRLKQTLNQ